MSTSPVTRTSSLAARTWRTILGRSPRTRSFPGASYLAALTEISRLDLTTGGVVLTVIAANAVMLMLLEIPLICFALAPTWTRTRLINPFLEKPELVAALERLMPLGRLADPEDMVGAVLFLVSRAAAMVTGHTLPVDGGLMAI